MKNMRTFHFYHILFFLLVGSLCLVKSPLLFGVIYALIVFLSFILLSNRFKIVDGTHLNFIGMRSYVVIQWVLLFSILFITNVHGAGLMAILLVLLYYLYVQWVYQHFQSTMTVATLEEDIKQFNDTFLTIRTERHDYVQHINTLHHFLSKKRFTEASQYIEMLVENYEYFGQSIRREQGHVASILYQYQLKANHGNIDVIYDLEQPLSSLPMEATDQMKLLNNLLNNAYDAAKQSDGASKEIHVMTSIYGGFYKLVIENSADRPPDYILDHLFNKFGMTTKGHDHEGLGTYIIADIVDRHDGEIKHLFDAGKMKIIIQIPVIKGEETVSIDAST